jgi:hypothetical protein
MPVNRRVEPLEHISGGAEHVSVPYHRRAVLLAVDSADSRIPADTRPIRLIEQK